MILLLWFGCLGKIGKKRNLTSRNEICYLNGLLFVFPFVLALIIELLFTFFFLIYNKDLFGYCLVAKEMQENLRNIEFQLQENEIY